MESNRNNYCHAIELALDTAAMEAEEGIATEMDTTITNTKENTMFNINKCNVNVNGHQCKRNRKSGCTIEFEGEIIYMCQQHYNNRKTSVYNVFHHTNINPVQEDDIMEENNFNEQLKLIVSGKYETIKTRASGTFLVEICNHEECNMEHWEDVNSARGEICCGVENCNHFYAFPCLDVQPVEINDVPSETKDEHAKVDGRFFIDLGIFTSNHKEQGMVKCYKCTKELPVTDPENDWSKGAWHSVEDLRKCLGAAPRPTENVVATIWTGKQGDKMQTQRFTDKKLAIAFCQELRMHQPVMKTVNSTPVTYTVTWKLS